MNLEIKRNSFKKTVIFHCPITDIFKKSVNQKPFKTSEVGYSLVVNCPLMMRWDVRMISQGGRIVLFLVPATAPQLL